MNRFQSMRKCLGSSVVLVMFATNTAIAGSKFFKVCHFDGNRSVASVTSGNSGCMTVSDVSVTSDKGGCVTFKLTCVGGACKTNVRVSVNNVNGRKDALVDYVCKTCGNVAVGQDQLPTVDECITDICTAGGDTVEDAIDVTLCHLDVPTVSEWGLVALTLVLLTAGTIVLMRRRAVAA